MGNVFGVSWIVMNQKDYFFKNSSLAQLEEASDLKSVQ